jgi:hypothetical protein
MKIRIVSCVLASAAAVGLILSPHALAQCDITPPSLSNFSFTPSSINTTTSSQTVSCSMTVADSPAGVAEAVCSFRSPSFFNTASCTATTPSSGTPQSGTFSCSITFPRYAESGVWNANVDLTDAVGNTQSLDPLLLGFPDSLTVTSDPDTTGPAMTAFSFSPTAVNVSTAAQNVTCNMTLTDAKAGVNTASCIFSAPNSSQGQGCVATAPSSGTRNSGTFSCTVQIPRYADAGVWTPGVFVTDLAGNFANPTATGTLTVTSSPEDIVAPSLTSFDFNPKSVNTSAASRKVTCSMGVADSTAGTNMATCTFTYTDPFNPFLSQTQSCTAFAPFSGTRNSGTFQCDVTIPRYSASGAWDADVQLDDLVGNSAALPQIPTLSVDCAGGDVETTNRFTNKQTLTWDAVAGASQYNVYRGNVSGLTDTNGDRKPDGGYGTCQNSRDPILTDTTFVDSEVPNSTQKGFHYLISYKSGGIEKGLGANSYGDPRTVASPCP